MSLLAAPFDQAEADAVDAGLRDPDPLVRIAVLSIHRFMPPEFRLQTDLELLEDDVRGVRIDAALAYAERRDYLPPAARQAFVRASKNLDSRRMPYSTGPRPT